MLINNLQSAIWMAGLVAHLLLLLILLVRGRIARYPIFTALIVFYVVRSGAPEMAFTHSLSQTAYLWLFWSFEIGDVALRALVLGELIWHAFRSTQVQPVRVVAWSAVAIAASAALAVLAGPMQSILVWSIFAKGNVAVAILSLITLAVLILTRNRTGLAWRSHELAIGIGLAFYAFVFLVLQGMRLWGAGSASPHGGGEHATTLRLWMQASAAVAYLLVVFYWLVAMWFDDRPRRSAAEVVERWSASIKCGSWRRRASPDISGGTPRHARKSAPEQPASRSAWKISFSAFSSAINAFASASCSGEWKKMHSGTACPSPAPGDSAESDRAAEKKAESSVL